MNEKPLYKIHIDSTKRYEKKVALVKTSKNKKEIVQELDGNIDIISSIDELLEKNGLSPANIAEYIPNTGPGSFTGIKIGITVANLLNWVNNKKSKLYKPNYGKEPNIQPKDATQ